MRDIAILSIDSRIVHLLEDEGKKNLLRFLKSLIGCSKCRIRQMVIATDKNRAGLDDIPLVKIWDRPVKGAYLMLEVCAGKLTKVLLGHLVINFGSFKFGSKSIKSVTFSFYSYSYLPFMT